MKDSNFKIAYLVSEYPSRSHTFIRRERDALINKGLNIHTLSIRKCMATDIKSDKEKKEHETTWAILPVSLISLFFLSTKRLFKSPRKFVSAFKLAWNHNLPGLKNKLWSIFYFFESLILSEQLEKISARHLHVHFANAGAHIGILCNALIDIPWSMTLHGACDFEYPAGPLLEKKLESAKFVACVSHYGRSQAMRTVAPEHWSKIELVRCGIERHQLLDFNKITDNESSLELCAIGRLSNEKGQLGLLEAFAHVLKQVPKAQLRIIGYGPDEDMLKARSVALGIDKNISWLGPKTEEQVIEHLRGDVQILALPSFMEGVPMVLMEAMGNGVCVVAPEIAGIPELVEDEVSGLLYHPADWKGMSEKICRLLSDQSLRVKLREHAWQKVNDEFCLDTSTDVLMAAFTGKENEQ